MPAFGSLFSGVGGMDLGLEWAGWECRFQVEIDDWRRQVLTRHWPQVPKWKDVREFPDHAPAYRRDGNEVEWQRRLGEQPCDLICGGFPCQDLSVAGRRAGLAGERSGLFFEFARIAGELKPQWLLIENVPGLLSSAQGLDFAIVLDTLDELGYGVAWRILNSQFFGVPQRRRRVFIVGHLGGPCPPEILFESEGGGGNPAARFQAGQGITHALGACSSISGRYDPNGETYVVHGRSNKPREFSSDPHGGGSLGVKVDTASYALDGGSQYVGSPVDPDGVRETTGTAGWLDACSRCPDGRRYAALGDAVTAVVAGWIGRRILKAME